ncbi:unnamed protein product, partial [marine sediment metagenome]
GVNTASNISNLLGNIGEAKGAGFKGAADARLAGAQNILSGISSAAGAAGGFTPPPPNLLGGGLPTDLKNPGALLA